MQKFISKIGSGKTSLITSHKEVKGIMKIIRSLEESSLFIKDVTKQLKMGQKK